MRYLTIWTMILLFAFLVQAEEQEDTEPTDEESTSEITMPIDQNLKAVIEFADGTTNEGIIQMPAFIIDTSYGTLNVPLYDIKTITMGDTKKGEEDSINGKAILLRGFLRDNSLRVKIPYGILEVPKLNIKRIRFQGNGTTKKIPDAPKGETTPWQIIASGGQATIRTNEAILQCRDIGPTLILDAPQKSFSFKYSITLNKAMKAIVRIGDKSSTTPALLLGFSDDNLVHDWTRSHVADANEILGTYKINKEYTIQIDVNTFTRKYTVSVNGFNYDTYSLNSGDISKIYIQTQGDSASVSEASIKDVRLLPFSKTETDVE